MSDFEDDDYDCSVEESEEEFDDMTEQQSDNEDDDNCMHRDRGDVLMFGKEDSDRFLMANDATVLSTENISEDMNSIVSEVAMFLGIKEMGICRILLHKFKWKKDYLIERFYEALDTNTFLRAHNALPDTEDPSSSSRFGECDICCEEAKLSGPKCNHYVCASCWEEYIKTKVMQDSCYVIECIQSRCKLILDDDMMLSYIHSEKTRNMYRQLTINAFVQANSSIKWCPAPECGRAIKVARSDETRALVCSCKNKFCFGCSHDWHVPLNCSLLKMWLQKCSDDSETGNWLMANTKDCPKCSVAIEKNGGCNRITCTSSGCRYEFCWMCMNDWSVHGYNPCNRYDESKNKEAKSAKEKSRAALERYLHYSNRFINHERSLKLENNLFTVVKSKMSEMQEQSMSWIEVQYLEKAVDVLSECRRTLMYTYGFAYFLERSNQVEIFEENQSDLEMATEQLSGFLERDLMDEDLVTLKQKVQDKSRYVNKRRIALLKHYVEGTEKDIWRYTQ